MLRGIQIVVAVFTLVACGCATTATANPVPVVGGPCDGCETIYIGMPKRLSAQARIAPPSEPGEPLVVEGTVRDMDGQPADGIVLYAYQTNADGIYPPDATRHGRLRAWVQTDSNGHYRFETIRPGSYPGRDAPQHIHVQVIEPDCGTYYIDNIEFADDPLVTDQHVASRRKRGGLGVVEPVRGDEGIWHARRDIVLWCSPGLTHR